MFQNLVGEEVFRQSLTAYLTDKYVIASELLLSNRINNFKRLLQSSPSRNI